jgi:hypothetical protein
VNKVDGAETLEYHYSLIRGTMKSGVLMAFVFFAWLLYARRCFSSVSLLLNKPEYNCFRIIGSYSRLKQIRLFFVIELWLMLPVLLYAVLMIIVGFAKGYYLQSVSIIVFFSVLLYAMSAGHTRRLNDQPQNSLLSKGPVFIRPLSNFPSIVIQFILRNHKFTWTGIKLFTCGILYLVERNNTLTELDQKTFFLFYSLGIMANAIIIYQARKFEETYLSFYRSLPVFKIRRLLQYTAIILLLLTPEIVTCFSLTPTHLLFNDAIVFSLSGFGLLLLSYSVSFARAFTAKEFLKILMIIFCLQYAIFMVAGAVLLDTLLFIAAISIFFQNYLEFERETHL